MSKFWLGLAAAVLTVHPLSGVTPAQSADETVRLVTNALSPTNNLVCSEKRILSTFRGKTRISETLYEYVVAAPKTTQNGQSDRLTAYAELVRINGKPVAKSSTDSNITAATIRDGGTTTFRSQRSYFDFSVSELPTPSNESNLVVEFRLKKGNPATPSTVPDFGRALVEKGTRQLVRLERTYLGLTQSAGPSFQNAETAIVENYGTVLIDGSPVRMVKTSSMRVTERSNRDMVRTFESEYSDCHKFDVSVTIRPAR